MSRPVLDKARIRSSFPAFQAHGDFVFGDNAGGSQIIRDAVDRVADYLITTNVQMGSDYMPTSTRRCMNLAQLETAKLFGAESPDEIVFGASSTQNLENLARGLEKDVAEGDEIIITGEHEGWNFNVKTISLLQSQATFTDEMGNSSPPSPQQQMPRPGNMLQSVKEPSSKPGFPELWTAQTLTRLRYMWTTCSH
jgi:hypothetical protein